MQPDMAPSDFSTWKPTFHHTPQSRHPSVLPWTNRNVNALSWEDYQQQRQAHGTRIRDPIHGDIVLGPLATIFYHTHPVQRLRHLHQNGAAHYVFPGAQHDRLAHSVGVAYLAWQQADQLRRAGADMTFWYMELLEVAGLLHDLGHGAFSHMFEMFLKLLLKAGAKHNWCHEHMSLKLLDYTVQHHHISIDDDSIAIIKDMMSGGIIGSSTTHWSGWAKDKQWLLQIVANAINGIDVDKVDYLIRDAVAVGICSSVLDPVLQGLRRIIQHSQVVDGQICYCKEVQLDVANLYQARAFMHHNVYQHPQVKAAELMVVAALKLADPDLHISSRVRSAEDYLTLDDRILYSILDQTAANPNSRNLQEAAATIKRLELRQLYLCVAEAEVPQEVLKGGYKPLKACDIIAAHNTTSRGNLSLEETDIAVHNARVDYCKGHEDPLKHVLLYSSTASGHTQLQQASEGCTSAPAAFMMRKERVYLTRSFADAKDQQAYTSEIAAAFTAVMQQRCGPEVRVSIFADDIASTNISSYEEATEAPAGAAAMTSRGIMQERRLLLDQAQQQLLQPSFFLEHGGSDACVEEEDDDELAYLSSQRSVQSQVALSQAPAVQHLEEVCAFGLKGKRKRLD